MYPSASKRAKTGTASLACAPSGESCASGALGAAQTRALGANGHCTQTEN